MKTLTAPLQALRREQLRGRLDPWLLLSAISLVAFGVVMVASSSIAVAEGEGNGPYYFLLRHLLFLTLGAGLAVAASWVPLAFWNRHSRALLLFGFLLLLLVLLPLLGARINGARRWLRLGLLNFQVVEAVKLLLILYLASYLVRFQGEVQHRLVAIVKPLGITALMVCCLLAQPDFGSSALFIVIAFGMVWLAGARLRDLGVLAFAATPMMAWAALSEGYRIRRLTSFLDPWQDPYASGFQLVQALIAVGRGEWFGVGLGGSVQKLFYLPAAHTDFIFAVIAEEFGLLGVVLVMAAFAVLCGRLFVLGARAIAQGLAFAGFVCHGVGLWIAAQALVSIGVNLGVLPTKGLTLPLISSGGSSLLMTLAALGVCLRVGLELTRAEAIAAIGKADSGPPQPETGGDHAH